MKGFRGKVIFGVIGTVLLVGSGVVMLMADNRNELFVPLVFVFAFAGGIVFWLIINFRESKRRKEENFRRKNR